MDIIYEVLSTEEVSTATVTSISRLMVQLNGKTVTRDEVKLVASTHTLVVARDERRRILGMATIVYALKLSGRTCLVEDVVVDNNSRGKGIGLGLMESAIKKAWEQRCQRIELTSRPERKEANNLYRKLGFKKRATNVYRLVL